MASPACATCRRIRECKLVTTKKLEAGESCRDWVVTDPEDLDARRTIIREFGLLALRFILPIDYSAIRRRRYGRRSVH